MPKGIANDFDNQDGEEFVCGIYGDAPLPLRMWQAAIVACQ